MNIVYVKDLFLPTGGYQVNFLSKWQVIHGHKVTIIAGDDMSYWKDSGFIDDEYVNHLSEKDHEFEDRFGVKVIRVHSYKKISSRMVLDHEFISIMKQLKPDIVFAHCSDTLTAMRIFRIAGRLSFPVLSDNHMVEQASFNPHANLFNKFCRAFITPKLIKYNIPIITLTEETRSFCKKRYGLENDMLPLIELGTDTTIFHPDKTVKEDFRKRYNIDSCARVFIYTGKIIGTKKVKLLAEAVKEGITDSFVLIVIGSATNEYGKETIDLFQNGNSKVLFFPTQKMEDLAQFYQASDVAIIPGACSLSFYDEQACGLPVIGENIPVMQERVGTDGMRGELYEVDSFQDLRRVIIKYATIDASTLQAQSENAVSFIRQSYDYNVLAKKVEELMIQLISSKK